MTLFRKRSVNAFALAGVSVLAVAQLIPSARATSISLVNVTAVVDGLGGGNPAFSDDVMDNGSGVGGVGPISVSAIDPYGRASSTAWAEIFSGPMTTSLRLSASSTAGGELSTAGALADASYQDTIFVGGGVLGDSVDIEVSWLLTYDLSSSPGISGLCGQDEASILASVTLGGLLNQFADSTCTGGQGDRSGTVVFSTFSGAELDIFAYLRVKSNSGYTGASDARADHSLIPVVTVLTPGYNYTTSSGNLFLAPTSVPEPSGLLLIASGILATRLRRRFFQS